jgi:hypothetical protein
MSGHVPRPGTPVQEGRQTAAPQVLTREQFPHLSDGEWGAYARLAEELGEGAVTTLLQGSTPELQHATIASFLARETDAARERASLFEDSRRNLQATQDRLASLEKAKRPWLLLNARLLQQLRNRGPGPQL